MPKNMLFFQTNFPALLPKAPRRHW